MFLDDTVNADKKNAKKFKLKNKNRVSSGSEVEKRKVILRRMEKDLRALKSMTPRG